MSNVLNIMKPPGFDDRFLTGYVVCSVCGTENPKVKKLRHDLLTQQATIKAELIYCRNVKCTALNRIDESTFCIVI